MPIEASPLPGQAPPAQEGSPQGGVTPANQNRGEPRNRVPGNEWAERIQELARKSAKAEMDWQKKEEAYQEQIGELTSRLEALEKRQNGNGRAAEPSDGGDEPRFRSWEEVPDSHIAKILRQGQGENPEAWTMAFEERLRRATKVAVEHATRAQSTDLERRSYSAQRWQEMVQTYGQELNDVRSDLRQRAEEYMKEKQKIAKRLGHQDPLGNPDIEEACIAKAYHELHSGDRDELGRLRRDAERLRQIEALESGARSARKAVEDESGRLLKEGKIGDSLRSLPLMKEIRSRFNE